PQPGQPLRIAVENRFDFTDLSELTIEWQAGAARGVVNDVRISPRSTGELTITPPADAQSADHLILTFTDPAGRLVEQERIARGNTDPSAESQSPASASPVAASPAAASRVSGPQRIELDGTTIAVSPAND